MLILRIQMITGEMTDKFSYDTWNSRQKEANWQEVPSYMHSTGQQRWQLLLYTLGMKAQKISREAARLYKSQ